MSHKNCDNRCEGGCGWKTIQDIVSCLNFYPFFRVIWHWPVTVTYGHRHLCHWMCLNGFYLIGAKYIVSRSYSIRDMASCLAFLPILGKIWPWPLTLTMGQGHRHLGHWMRLIGLYLGTKYQVCRRNSLRDMTSSLFFYQFFRKFDLDLRPWPLVKVIST